MFKVHFDADFLNFKISITVKKKFLEKLYYFEF